MSTIDRPRIALWCNDPQLPPRWRDWLRDAAHELVDSLPRPKDLDAAELAAIAADGGADVICTDAAELEARLAERRGRQEIEPWGLIVVGGASDDSSSADAGAVEYRPGRLTRLRLPADTSGPMLKLACQLLIDAVRLRRHVLHAGRAHEDLARQALVDPLTGLANRRAWDSELARRIAAAENTGGSLTLAIFDLDRFKAVNDRHGHDAGDALLQAAAAGLRRQLRERDFLARLGGDEFGLLISGVEPAIGEQIVERVRAALAQAESDGELHPMASAGVAVRPARSSLNAQQLYQLADQALLEAKRTGRGKTMAAEG